MSNAGFQLVYITVAFRLPAPITAYIISDLASLAFRETHPSAQRLKRLRCRALLNQIQRDDNL